MNGNIGENEAKKLFGKLTAIPKIDKTLARDGYCADAKETGDRIRAVNTRIDDIDPHYAAKILYSHTESGLEATQVQAAIDEIARKYLPKIGGRIDMEGYDQFGVNNTVGEASYMGFYGNGVLNGYLGMRGKDNPMFCTADGDIKALHHAGNKPLGTYEGNGSTALRTIDTGGIGKLLLVYSTNGVGFVVPRGALKIAGSAVSWLTSSGQYYGDGILRLATDDAVFNQSGVTYTYQVI